jgi:hypothetical protein
MSSAKAALRWAALGAAARLDRAGFAERVLGFAADARQREVLEERAGRLLLCCSRQWGKSSTAAALIATRAVAEPGSLILCVAPTLRQCGELIGKVRHFLAGARVEFCGGRQGGKLGNGSRVVALPGNEAYVRGFSAPSLIVVDEAARVSDVLYQALRPMLVVGRGDLALLSTPFGERGFFWKEWAQGGEQWVRIRVPATECPRMDAGVLEEERRVQSAEWFAQEYLCSFVGMENPAFRAEWLAAARAEGLGVKGLAFRFRGGMLG